MSNPTKLMWKHQCVRVESLRKGDLGENTCRLMARPRGKALFLSVNHHKWLQSLVLMTLALCTNEAKGFVNGPKLFGEQWQDHMKQIHSKWTSKRHLIAAGRESVSFPLSASLPYSWLFSQVKSRHFALCPVRIREIYTQHPKALVCSFLFFLAGYYR